MLEHEAWLFKADNDIKTAKKLIRDEDVILDTSIYHTQQAAEKALFDFRYPDDILLPELEEVKEAITCAEKILRLTKKIIDLF